MEDFVTYNIAEKLNEKGFDWICSRYYSVDNKKLKKNEYWGYEERISAPTISQVLKWLRDEKEIDIVIEPIFFYDDNSNRIRNYNCVIFAPQLNKPKHYGYYDKWKESAIAGIEYTLKNLI